MSAIPNSNASRAGDPAILLRPASRGTPAPAPMASDRLGPRDPGLQAVIERVGTAATWGDAASRLGVGAAQAGPKINRALKHNLRGAARKSWKAVARDATDAVRGMPRGARKALKAVTSGRVFKALAKPVAALDLFARGSAVANAKDTVREAAVQGVGLGAAAVGAAKGAAAGVAACGASVALVPAAPLCGAVGAVAGGLAGDWAGQKAGGAAVDVTRHLIR